MYTITFYSFKGGVGRSMALVNVAAQLAESGKRVLLMDFDLEAPGLPTFGLCRSQSECLGLVDFVTEYMRTGQAPDVKDFVYKSHQFVSGGEIWVMPVGRQDVGYSHRLNSINWQELYSKKDGFFLFEDIKKQLSEYVNPDYLLIDSRTGHSDVEGICTRQLPDSVCLLFFPNEQNLAGLTRVSTSIRDYVKRTPRRAIDLHFVMSNVPDLDDEDQVLDTLSAKFKSALGYDTLAAEIHHYNSMALLDQEIFSITRPNSKLAREYFHLVSSLTKNNMEDRSSVIGFLKNSHENFSQITSESDPDELRKKIENILKNFSTDGEISFLIALLYEQIGSIKDALSIIKGDPVEANFYSAHMLAVRSRLFYKAGEKLQAAKDLEKMLDADNAEFETFMDAFTRMEQLAPELVSKLPTSVALGSLSGPEQLYVANQLDTDSAQVDAQVEILKNLLRKYENSSEDFLDGVTHFLAVAYISSGKSGLAAELLEKNFLNYSKRISTVFNMAMARWGVDKTPPLDLFRKVIDINSVLGREESADPNYAQCIAIACFVLGENEKGNLLLSRAREMILERPRREFSAWSYRKEDTKNFLKHLEEIQELAISSSILPRFAKEYIQ